MEQTPLISVIIPIYNVENYLERCLQSIIRQTYTHLEIILVDDGSTDSCPQICDEYKTKDSRIKVIHKENGGLSDARNKGLDAASGAYISFIDSDDWIDLKTYELSIQKIQETNAEVLAFNVLWVYEGKEFTPDLSEEYEVMNSQQAILTTVGNTKVRTTAWNKLYRTDLIGDFRFLKGKLNEDEFFTFRILDKAKTIVYLHRECYYYFQRNNSIMGKYTLRRLDMVEGVRERMLLAREKYPAIYKATKLSFCEVCLYHYQMILNNKDVDKDGSGRKKLKRYRNEIHLTKRDVSHMNFINRVSFLMSNNSTGLSLAAHIRNLFKYGI